VKLAASDLLTLESYARERAAFRDRVRAHKRARQLQVGPHTTWSFEDRLTVQYQIQEMLRVERIFEPEGIQAELDAYNPLIPDGHNWKVTLLIEFAQPEERRRQLSLLKGIERRSWVEVASCARVFAIADEDLPREDEDKTSAVHFLRFELAPAMTAALRAGAALSLGIDHEHYRYALEPVPPEVRSALLADLE